MKALFIGGTGRISGAISKRLIDSGEDLYLVNRGNRNGIIESDTVTSITVDINDEEIVARLIEGQTFDVVVDFIGYKKEDVERDYRLFKNKTKQFIFISSASAYQKPPSNYSVNEGTSLANPFWEYSRNKIECEEFLMKCYREEGFPITIVRPSHTYDERSIPVGVHGDIGSWQVAKRMLEGKPVIIHGDGTSLWTLTHTKDFAKAFVGLMGNIHAIGQAVQITSDESLTWNQIYQTIAEALEVELKAVHVSSDFLDASSNYDFHGGLMGDKANVAIFDNSKLKALVPGFVAKCRFDEGIKETVNYILKHKELQLEDEAFDKWCDAVIEELEEAKIRICNRLK